MIGIDSDAAMLSAATGRLGKNLQTVEDNFEQAAIPPCDVVSASFALHHIPTGGRKAAVYQRCFAALRAGGHAGQRRLLPRGRRQDSAAQS